MSIETEAAALAAMRRNAAHLAAMEALLARIDDCANHQADAADSDFDLHVKIAEATGNPWFAELLRHLGRAIIPRTRIDSAAAARASQREYLQRVNREHHDVFEAIRRSDSDAARAAMRTHLGNSRERLRRLADGAQDR